MSSFARDRIRRCLAIIPLVRARPGIRIPELAGIFGVKEAEIWEDITEILTLCGVPPYLPHNYLVFSIHRDQVAIRFAEHLARPVRLTLQEALAIDLALRTVSGGKLPAFGDAAPRLRRKIREVLGRSERQTLEALDGAIGGSPPSDEVSQTIALLKDAMARNVSAEISYYTASRDSVGTRTIEPYGLLDHSGHWYVVARDSLRGKQIAFRVDRIRSIELKSDAPYEVPDAFTTEAFRRNEMWEGGPGQVGARVRFAARWAGRVREETPHRQLQAEADGSVVKTFWIDPERPRWLFTHVARFGADAEVVSPPEVRKGMAAFLDGVLERQLVAVPPPRKTAEAAAVRPRRQPEAKRRPDAGRRPAT